MAGRVYLVGAGPGDPSLITQRGVWVIQSADVILYDYLVPLTLLGYAKKTALIDCVGKRKGAHSSKQSDINNRLVAYAKEGKRVVRLKGGDPFVFGRGGEEVTALKAHGIPFEVVPGVSSCSAVPSYAGICVTHRQVSRSVALITGTSASETGLPSEFPKVDTLIVFMGVTHLARLIDVAIASGYSAQTPIAVLMNGTGADERALYGTLSTISDKLSAESGPMTPALLVLGAVVSAAYRTSWREHLPLVGKRLILLRSLDKVQEWYEYFSLLGAEVLCYPLIESSLCDTIREQSPLDTLKKTTTIIFSSATGVTCFMEWLFHHGMDSRSLAHKRLVCVGPKTEEALRRVGCIPDSVAQESRQEGLLALFSDSLDHECILIPQSQLSRPLLEEELTCRGAEVHAVPLYETHPSSMDYLLTLRSDDCVIFSSPSTVDAFFRLSLSETGPYHSVALGLSTFQALSRYQRDRTWQSKGPLARDLLDVLTQI